MNKKRAIYISIATIFTLLLWVGYSNFISTTKIATLNFPDFTVEKFIRSNNNPWVKIETVGLDEVDDIAKYDIVMVRIHGASMTKIHLDAIKAAIERGVAVFSTESDNDEINSLGGSELGYISALMDNGSIRNYQSMFNYLRKNVDNKVLFNGVYSEPHPVPADYFFHLGEDEFFATFEEYQRFYEKSGKYKEGAPRIVMLSGNINMQNSNEEHMSAIINSLEKRGLNVYPINSFGSKKLGMIADVEPSLIINRPHGRLVMGGGDSGIELLKSLNVPILAPVTVSELYSKWLTDKQGMTSGGMTAMSIVMPELDGAIAPFAVAAQFERNGMNIFDAIPEHTEKFCSMVEKFTTLQTKTNNEKRVAIYYYKGMGKGTLSAADIEGVNSLYNTLTMLKANGYDLTGLPDNVKDFEAMIQRQGSVLGPYALGAYAEFLKNGNPALVNVEKFKEWSSEILPAQLIADMEAQYGEAPGDYMGVEKDGEKYIAIARLQFGNVTILPQPLPSVGDNTEQLIHGVAGAPAYPYVASYMWTREEFDADALIHFGTHGSLEFIPGKQVALSDYDWSDVLVGDMPHFYIYTINNIGEGIIAKRRSYATLVTHLTAPFMQSELYDDLRILKDRIHRLEHLEESNIKQNHRETITKLANSENILSALSIDTTKILNDEEIERVHIYLEEIDGAKVNDGLYTLGVPYSTLNLNSTTRLMSIDPIRYSLATIDVARGKVSVDDIDNFSFISHEYNAKTDQLIERALRGENTTSLFNSLTTPSERALLDKRVDEEKVKGKMMKNMMKQMEAKSDDKMLKFLDDKGGIILGEKEIRKKKTSGHPSWIPKDGSVKPEGHPKEKKATSMMGKMAQAKPVGVKEQDKSSKDEELINALKTLKEALASVATIHENLYNSTQAESAALLDALSGGYIEPSSAGDPIVNPKAVPTGRNFYAINPETTPTVEAWKEGRRLAENLLDQEFESKGRYPEKVSFTLWSSDFISTEGATIGQILYLLGVEPLRDGFGYIRSLRLIPSEQLGRPRVDVVVQTSGQLRDIAASRLELINRAITMAAESEDKGDNFVRKGFDDAERRLLEKGFSPVDARKYSRERVFGGANGNYGTGIMSMVEKGDSWDKQSQIAEQYISNMSGMYSSNGSENWGEMRDGVFEAALLNTSVVVQPRSSNTWGPLSLDHVYEFMGGLSAAVQHVTGDDPTAYFNDFRNSTRSKVQELKESIGVETNSTVFNPKYIKEMMNEEASAMGHFAEVFRNTYGWNSMKPSAIDQHIWNSYYDIYIQDEYKLGLEQEFKDKNPYALQEMTAVMMESARKGMWKATQSQLKEVAKLHTELVVDHEAGCSGFVCDNAKLRDFISKNVDKQSAQDYNKKVDAARQVQLNEEQSKDNVVLKKEEQIDEKKQSMVNPLKEDNNRSILYIMGIVSLLIGVWFFIRNRRK